MAVYTFLPSGGIVQTWLWEAIPWLSAPLMTRTTSQPGPMYQVRKSGMTTGSPPRSADSWAQIPGAVQVAAV